MLFLKLDGWRTLFLSHSLNLHIKSFSISFYYFKSLMYKRIYFLLICFIHMSPLKINRSVIYLLPLHKIPSKKCIMKLAFMSYNMLQYFFNYHFVNITQWRSQDLFEGGRYEAPFKALKYLNCKLPNLASPLP